MRYIMIAVLYMDNKVVGARLLDKQKYNILNFDWNQIKELIGRGNEIVNLGVKNGNMIYTQGSVKRYPKVHLDKGYTDNKGARTILGCRTKNKEDREMEKGSGKIFHIIDYAGNIVPMDEEMVVRYGEKHSLTNCKIVSKNKSKHIALIRGRMEDMIRIIFKYDSFVNKLHINVLLGEPTKIKIPKSVVGKEVKSYIGIEVYPEGSGVGVIELDVPDTIRRIDHTLGHIFPNLKVLKIRGLIRELTESNYNKLETLVVHKIDKKSRMVIPPNIKRVLFEITPKLLSRSIFANCKYMNTGTILREGIIEVGSEVFLNMGQIVNIDLPKSLEAISSTAFLGCRNIKSMRINNNNLRIYPGTVYEEDGGHYQYTKMFEETSGMIIYCSHEFPVNHLKRMLSNKVKIVKDKPLIDTRIMGNKIKKAEMLGIKIRRHDVAVSIQEAIGFLSMMTENIFRQKLEEKALKLGESISKEFILENYGTYLEISFADLTDMTIYNMRKVEYTDNYMVVTAEDGIFIFLSSKERLLNILKYAVKRGHMNALNVYGRVYGSLYRMGQRYNYYVLNIPARRIELERDNVANIIDRGRKVEIVTVSGESVYIDLL